MSYFLAAERAEIADRDVDDAVVQAERLRRSLLDRQHQLVLVPRAVGVAEREHLDLLELVRAEDARACRGPRRRPRAGSRTRARVAQGQRVLVEDLAHVQRGERDLRGADEEQVVARRVERVDLLAVGGEEAGAVRAPARAPAPAASSAGSRGSRASRASTARARGAAAPGRRGGRRSASPRCARARSMSISGPASARWSRGSKSNSGCAPPTRDRDGVLLGHAVGGRRVRQVRQRRSSTASSLAPTSRELARRARRARSPSPAALRPARRLASRPARLASPIAWEARLRSARRSSTSVCSARRRSSRAARSRRASPSAARASAARTASGSERIRRRSSSPES